MFGLIEVTETVDSLHRRVWSFHACDLPRIRLSRCEEQERTSTRHKWRTVSAWSQYRGERFRCDLMPSEPEPNQAVRDQAIANLVSMLRFERWPERKERR